MKPLLLLLSIVLSSFNTTSSQNAFTISTLSGQSKYINIGAQNNSQGVYEIFQFMRMMPEPPIWDNSCKNIRKGKSYIKVQIAQREQNITYQFKFRNEKYNWEDDRVIVFTRDNIKNFGKNLCLFLESKPGQFISSQQYALKNEKEDTGSGIAVYVEDGYCLLSRKQVKKLINVIDEL